MKKSFFYLKITSCFLVFLMFVATVSMYGQSPSVMTKPVVSKEFAADLNRPQIARGEHPGLLIVTHGSPAPSWKKMTEKLVKQVRSLNQKTPAFDAVEICDMEFNTNNDIVAGVKRLEAAGCDTLIVVPAFIFPTSHVQFDVAAILGVYSSNKVRDELKEEGIRMVRTKTPITLTPVFCDGDLLTNFTLTEAMSVAKETKNERLLIIAHGDKEYSGMVNRLLEKPVSECKNLGFDSVECAFCGMGQTFGTNVKPIIEKNTKEGKKTLIVAIYLASSAKSFIARVQKFPAMNKKNKNTNDSSHENSLQGLNYKCSQGSLADFAETPMWIFEKACQAKMH